MMDENNRNFILALVLSVLVIFTWQALFVPKEEPQTPQQQTQQVQKPAGQAASPGVTPQPNAVTPAAPQQAAMPAVPAGAVTVKPREAVLQETQRVAIDTPSLQGSIALKGARLDDLTLKHFKETVKKNSDRVTLLSPSGSPKPYYAEYGWSVPPNTGVKVPNADTIWTPETQGPLTPERPVTLRYDNGEGLVFRRTVAVDRDYMFTVTQQVENTTNSPVTLYPYALISRHGQPKTSGFYILHEGLIGVMGEEGLQEIDYTDALEASTTAFKATSGWIGITDKYWATALIPDQKAPYEAHFRGWDSNNRKDFQTDFLLGPVTVAPGAKQSVSSMLFAGAKQTQLLDEYEEKLGINKFELLIDWGWFHFITKPLFYALDFFNKHVGNFGVAILIVTVLIKLTFFPLANKSYESMSKMKKLQPEMLRIRDRFKDDRVRQQQAMMELYKKEKVNPMSGCLPIVIQIPVFFALYKVLYVTIEARQAPFFGWIQDLSAPDPTSLFNLFGLIPWDPPHFLMIGIWPILMGITMFVQMKLNPAPTDPIQQQIFTWMPLLFTFLLAAFPAGLVIYWTWNNALSILQQWVIMRRQGVEVNLLENIGFRKSAGTTSKS
jgi:YidC/Oxa1 family membrane protein insertase